MKKNRGEEVANQLHFILSIDVNLANALPTSRGLHPKIKLRKKKKKKKKKKTLSNSLAII